MIRRLTQIAALSLACITSLHATVYTIDPRHTQGTFSWEHLGFSNPSAQFTLVRGSLHFDPADPTKASVVVTIPLDEINTGVPELNAYLRDDAFFDLAKYSTATFTSTKVEKGMAPDKLKVTGNLDLHGHIKPVVLDVTINKVGVDPRDKNLPMVGFDATTTLKRSDFGLGLYVGLVSDEIRIHITCQGIEAQAYAAHQRSGADEAAKDATQKAKIAKDAKLDADEAAQDAIQKSQMAKDAEEKAAAAAAMPRSQ